MKGGEKMNKTIKTFLIFFLSITAVLSFTNFAFAATTIVTPNNTQGWSTADTRPGGAVNFVSDSTSPLPTGALQLKTDNTSSAKAQYMHAANISISSVNKLEYNTKQISGPSVADPSYQLVVDLNGSSPSGLTTFVYEPYWNGTVTQGTWQKWSVDTGKMWSSRAFTDGSCTVAAGAGGPPFYTLSDIKTMCPNAQVLGFGVNIGSGNPGYVVETDGVTFNETTYNFELLASPASRADCQGQGWKNFHNPSFVNEGDCQAYITQRIARVWGNAYYTAYGLERRAIFNAQQSNLSTYTGNGTFRYSDANKDSYTVNIQYIRSVGKFAYFAGPVTSASNPAWVGQWLFAKAEDDSPDKIWGSFTTQTAAIAGAQNASSPSDGPFNVIRGDVYIYNHK